MNFSISFILTFTKVHPLDELLKKLGIKHHKIQPRTPQHNGKVERSHRNDNERFYSYLKFYNLEDLREQGKRYLKRSNNNWIIYSQPAFLKCWLFFIIFFQNTSTKLEFFSVL